MPLEMLEVLVVAQEPQEMELQGQEEQVILLPQPLLKENLEEV
jgi:hypothetical protein